MARRKKTTRRKSPKTVSLWNLGVGWIYLTGLTKMATNTGPVEFLLAPGDLAIDAAQGTENTLVSDSWNYGGR